MPARPRNNRTPDGAKKRWSPDDRARRDSAPGHRGSRSAAGEPARRPSRSGGEDAGSRRPDWSPGPRVNPRDRFARPDREQGGDRRPSRGADRGERRPFRTDDRDDRRPSRDQGPDRGARASFRSGGDERGGRPPFRGDRPERAPFRGADDRGERRPFRSDDRGDRRPARADDRGPRPSFRSDDRGDRRPSFRSDDRPARSDDRRPPFRADDRADDRRPPRADDRGAARTRSDRDDRGGSRPTRGDDRAPRRDDRRPERSDDRRPARSDAGDRRGADRGFRGDDARRGPRDDRSGSGRARFGFDDRSAAPREGRWQAPEDVVLERLDAEVVTADEVTDASFTELGLGQRISEALADLGAVSPFPIQAATIPVALTGRNVLGRGRTGSGKTIAFGAAMIERLMRNWADSGRSGSGRRTGRPPRALILAPTRELALQIDRTVQPISRAVGLYTTQIVGGVPQARQVGALSKGVDIVIGTPGRIEDLLEQGRLDLSQVEITVLDEADHMAELGFLEPMRRLLSRVPAKGQRMLFSATLDSAVAQLVEEFLPDPAVHEVADAEGGGTADHRVLVIDPTDKLQVLVDLIGSVDRALVFARTRAFAEQLADDLDGAGVRAESLHGDLNQARRTRNLARFSDGQVKALVATDVAARGIHVDAIDLVVHADMAEEYKAYLHRSGRTGRAGAAGTVVTLIGPRRRRAMTALLERAGVEADFVVLQPGADPAKRLGL